MARLLAAVLVLAQQENPDLKYKAEIGISIQKPPKNEEWGFKDKAFWSNPHMCVSHKVDSINIEVLGEAPPEFNVVVPSCGRSPLPRCEVTVPPEFLKAGRTYLYEVLAIEKSGNQTITEGDFETSR